MLINYFMVYRKSNFLFVLHMKISKKYPQWWDILAKLKKFPLVTLTTQTAQNYKSMKFG